MRRFRRGAAGGAPADWLIVGLGNPGAEHAGTRHNVGFMVAERLCERWDLGRVRDVYRGRLAVGRVRSAAFLPPEASLPADRPDLGVAGASVAVLCPLTFMNAAGRSAGPARGALKVPLERVLVVHDEIDLRFGDVRTRLGGGLAGHNGLKSLKHELGSADFMRVRVGVGRPDSSDPEIVSAYVLGRFRETADEVRQLIDRACEAVERVVLGME